MIDLIIFDCDGVLVDSEAIASRTLAAAATSENVAISAAESMSLFRGLKFEACLAQIEQRAGHRLRASFADEVRAAMALAFERELQAVAGVHYALSMISIPVCVASNGPIAKIRQTLALTNLLGRFEERIFSAYDVSAWKPDPGLFLHAAASLGAPTSHCLVIEDSLAGVVAALAANMQVLAYSAGNPGQAEQLRRAGATTFTHMAQLPGLIYRLDAHRASF